MTLADDPSCSGAACAFLAVAVEAVLLLQLPPPYRPRRFRIYVADGELAACSHPSQRSHPQAGPLIKRQAACRFAAVIKARSTGVKALFYDTKPGFQYLI